jgi:hypothetical protein
MSGLVIYPRPKPIFGSKHGYLVAKHGKERLCVIRRHTKVYKPDYSLGRIRDNGSWRLRNGRFRRKEVIRWLPFIPAGFYVSVHGESYMAHEPDEFWQAIIADLSGA